MKDKSTQTLFRSVFSYTTAMVIAQALIALYTVILILWLDTEHYGNISANYAAVLLTSFVINLGLHEWLLRSIPLAENPKTLTGNIFIYKLITGVIWALGLLLILPRIQPEIYIQSLLLIIILDVWFESCFNLFLVDLVAHQRIIPASILLIVSKLLRLLSIGAIVLIESKSIYEIALFRMVSTFFIFLSALIVVKPVLSQIKRFNFKQILRASFIFNAVETQNLIFLQLDLNLLTIISGNTTLIGNFAIVISIINMIMTIPLGIASLILPHSLQSVKSSFSHFKKRMQLASLGFLALGVIIFGVIQLVRINFFHNLLEDNFQDAVSLLLLISPLLFIRTLNQSNRVYLLTVNWERKQLLPQTIAIFTKILAGILAIQHFGLSGLVWVSIMSETVIYLGFSWQVVRHKIQMKSNPIL